MDAVLTSRHPLRHVHGIKETFCAAPAEWASVVEKQLLTGKYALLLNVDEPGLLALSRHSWQPEAARFLPFLPGSEIAATVGSKKAFHDWCLTNGLAVPETHYCHNFEEAFDLAQGRPGAWLVKGDTGSGGQTVLRVSPNLNPMAVPVQQSRVWLVQKDEGHDVGSGIFLADHGRLVAWMGIKKIVCLQRGFGPTVLGRGDVSPDLGALCKRVAAASGVTGLTGFDFVRSPDRGLLLIDSHLGRMSPMQHFDSLYGVDFAASLRALLHGKPASVTAPAHGPAFIKFPEIIQLALQGGLGNLLKETTFSVKMPLSPPGDPLIGIRTTLATTISQTRVSLGRWRRLIFSGKLSGCYTTGSGHTKKGAVPRVVS